MEYEQKMSFRSHRRCTKYLNVALQWWHVDKVSPIKLFEENKTIAGFNLRHLLYQQNKADYVSGILNKVFDLWKESKIAPVIDSKWALEDVRIKCKSVGF